MPPRTELTAAGRRRCRPPGSAPAGGRLLVFLAALCLGGGAARPAEPPPALTLHAPFTEDVQPQQGPGPEVLGEASVVADEAAGGYLSLTGPAEADRRAPAVPLLAWPVARVLRNAQGAVSFRVRLSPAGERRGPVVELLRLRGGGGGRWRLLLQEAPYRAERREESADEARALAAEYGKVDPAGLELATGEGVAALDLQPEAAEPLATVTVQAHLSLWPEGEAKVTIRGRRDIRTTGAWHHVVWTWRSLHHAIYIDGELCGRDRPGDRISRLAPLADESGRLELLAGAARLRDLRFYNRYLEAADARCLAGLEPASRLVPPPPARLRAEWGYPTGRVVAFVEAGGAAGAASARVTCLEAETERVLARATDVPLPEALGEVVLRPFDPDPFPAGTYCLQAELLDSDGALVGRARSEPWTATERPWPFLGFAGGRRESAQTRVIPPFTAVTVDGPVVRTVLRDHRLGDDGLPVSIRADGGELLSGPVRLDVITPGGPLAFAPDPGLGAIRHDETAADWQAVSRSAEGHRLTVAGRLEYDGVIAYDVTLAPRDRLEVRRIELHIPYRPEVARLCHSGNSFWFGALERDGAGAWSCRRINWRGPGPPRERRADVLFDSFDGTLGLFPPPVRFRYTPYLHVGNRHRGLSWFVDNDRHWRHDPAIPPLEFLAAGERVSLRLNLVARPSRLEQPVTWRFYLLANPVKPLPPRWRSWGVGRNRRSNKLLQDAPQIFWWHWGAYAEGFRPYPGPLVRYGAAGAQAAETDGKTYADWAGAFKGSDIRHTPFINFGTPGGFPAFNPSTMVYPYTWKLHNTRPHRDYVAYWLDRCVRDIGIDGVYVDEPYSDPYSYNVLASDAAYIRPDGTRGLGFRYLEGREYIRRLKQLFTDHGRAYSIWMHNTNYRALPVMTFADIGMDGEHPQIWVKTFTDYHRYYNPKYSRGYISGRPFGFVGAQMYHMSTNPEGPGALALQYRKDRSYLAVTLPYEVLPMRTTLAGELDRIQNLQHAFGLAETPVAALSQGGATSWWPGVTLTPGPRGLAGVRHPDGDRALLYLGADPAQAGCQVRIAGRVKTLLPGAAAVHLWNAENGAALRIGEEWRVPVPPGGFAALWAEARQAPQPPRPPGALLGLSFDRGVAAAFGGGWRPVTVEPAAPPEELLTDGQDGGGLAVGHGRPRVGYAVVPGWFAGALGFDLKVAPDGGPARLAALAHHLNCSLDLVRRDGQLGLLLTTREGLLGDARQEEAYARGRLPDGPAATCFAPLPAGAPGDWMRVLLTWRCGQYRLYADGRPLEALTGRLCVPRLRDATAPARGLWLGGGEARRGDPAPAAVLDNLTLYDWTPAPDAAAGRGPGSGPLVPPPPGETFAIWTAWRGDELGVGVAAGRLAEAHRATAVRFRLYAAGEEATPLSTDERAPLHGYAWGLLLAGGDRPAMGGADDLLPLDADDEAPPVETTYRLRVEWLRRARKEKTEEVLARRETTVVRNLLETLLD
jgi:hypothetical protein